MSRPEYELTIGLEVHVELRTATKMFCRCSARFGDPPNTNVCPTCLGYPGALPVPNEEAVRLGVRAATALNCQINLESRFDRKNYFYPDLPKGYQITQYDRPLAVNGYISVGDPPKKIRIRRLHLEEDTGKSLHAGEEITTATYSFLDYNRSGVPLAEIVSEPDITTPEEAREYLEKIRRILLYAGVSDVKIEEGSMRVDCNVSVKPAGSDVYGTPVEIKNLGSFRAVVRAIAYERSRQVDLLESGCSIIRETRHWDEGKGVTVSMRGKETSDDYRYFPDPDLPLLKLSEEFVNEIQKSMPLMPDEIIERYSALGLTPYDAGVLTQDPRLSKFFDDVVECGVSAKAAANWIMGDLMGYMKQAGYGFERFPISAADLASLIGLIESGTISGKIAKDVLVKAIDTKKPPSEIVKEEGLEQVSDESSLGKVIDQVIAQNPEAVLDVKSGKEKAIGYLVGQVMKLTKGKANPSLVNIMVREKIL